MIADYLIENFESTLKEYFPYKESSKNWENEFRNKIGQINHDEPWLTLIACYSIFRNQEKYTSSTLLAVNKLLGQSGFGDRIQFSEINEVTIEKRLPRIKTYQYYLHKLFREGVFHLYPDRNTIINEKLKDKNSYFEGSTHLDLLIQGVSKGKTVSCFIEAKFLSDISYQID